MSKAKLSKRLLTIACCALAASAVGCQEKPERNFSEYGETISSLPVVRDLPVSAPIADELESRECHFRTEAEEQSLHNLYQSQGRELEFTRMQAQKAAEERQRDLEIKRKRELSKATEEPVAEGPVAEGPVAEGPVAEEPVAEEPGAEEPVAEEPVAEESVVDEPVVEEPVAEEPVAEEPVVDEPVAEEPEAE